MIEVTPSASQAVKAVMAERNLDSSLRVTLSSGGWSGPSLGLVLDEPTEHDEKYEIDGLTYLIDKKLSQQSGDIKLDYVDRGYASGLVLTSANPIGGGGCGPSCSCW